MSEGNSILNTPSEGNQDQDSSAGNQSGRWTKEEHLRFVQALQLHGRNWKKVEEHVGTRSGAQIRSHAQKFFNRLQKEFNLTKEDVFNNLSSLDKVSKEYKMDGSITKKRSTSDVERETPVMSKNDLKEKEEAKIQVDQLQEHLETFSRQIDNSIKSINETKEENLKAEQILSWNDLISGIMRIIQQFNRDLNNENPRSTKIQYYEQFLKVLGGKLDQLNHLNNDEKQINISFLGKRPHSFSEDNIMTDLRQQVDGQANCIPSIFEMVNISKEYDNDAQSTSNTRRKPSFKIHEESQEKLEKLKKLKELDFSFPTLGQNTGRKRVMSFNL